MSCRRCLNHLQQRPAYTRYKNLTICRMDAFFGGPTPYFSAAGTDKRWEKGKLAAHEDGMVVSYRARKIFCGMIKCFVTVQGQGIRL